MLHVVGKCYNQCSGGQKQLLRFCPLGSWTVTDAEIYVVFLSFTFTVLACTRDAMLLEEIQLRRKTRGHF